ncbi:putative lipid II flippase FtsW [Paenactinomyces guangxiensis]|uniref:Probable peptidoglycan glycosyltransferase FtsW n=1 Tax=Paenactinomyces guangxiensis TaxID=1490290 RepID=A0A7W2A756_9BACL|nr:putative lipid II flippase FtsW [Paenactinomyces guangxiensis]MBA4493205.1 putative lipid II flippase FtsW [Paenactinomyces guangxiensis]MBH8589945.1 putative lipid II flippase FtsW [Paenactinomyces guangxiensis]
MKRDKPDFWIILITFLLLGFGLVMVFSTSYYKGLTDFKDPYFFFNRQLGYGLTGLVLFFIFSNIPYTIYRKYVGLILIICFVSLLVVLIPPIGKVVNNARRWIDLGIFSFQPSEYVKLGLIIYTASIMIKKQPIIDNFKRAVIPPLVVIGIACLLLMKQPHFSAIVIILTTCITVMFCAGTKVKHLLFLALVGLPVLVVALFLGDYRVDRITALFNGFSDRTGEGYQVTQSLIAIGPGGLTGAGLGNSIQKYAYLPEAHTDFIFSIIAEELGFIGGVFLISLFIFFIVRGVLTSLQAPDQFGTLLGIGIVTLLAVEAIFNLAVVTALFPVTGVPLPLISYGGTALMMNLVELGILINISRYRVRKAKASKAAPSARPVQA